MIYDYSQYLSFDAHYGQGFVTKNRDLIDVFNTNCPFCGDKLKQYFYFQRYDSNIFSNECVNQWESIFYCEQDGWWQHKINEQQDRGPKAWYAVIHEGILAKYDETANSVPIEILSDYIKKNPENITHIHDKKMEELVASVFRSFYNCDAKVIGKSSDGGVDIILIYNDNPIMVQVKRRKSRVKTESVAFVRELLGATLLHQSKNCIFVTTADKFSKDAKKTASLAIDLGLVQSYELVDYSRFIDMLQTKPINIERVWENLKTLDRLKVGEHYGLAYV